MFVYQNVNRDICVTFKSNKPVADPEYVISIDNATGAVRVNGKLVEAASKEAAKPAAAEKATKSTAKTTTKATAAPAASVEEVVEEPKADE